MRIELPTLMSVLGALQTLWIPALGSCDALWNRAAVPATRSVCPHTIACLSGIAPSAAGSYSSRRLYSSDSSRAPAASKLQASSHITLHSFCSQPCSFMLALPVPAAIAPWLLIQTGLDTDKCFTSYLAFVPLLQAWEQPLHSPSAAQAQITTDVWPCTAAALSCQ